MDRLVMTDFGAIIISKAALREAQARWPGETFVPGVPPCSGCGEGGTEDRIIYEWDTELSGRVCAFVQARYIAGYNPEGLKICSLSMFGIKG